MFPLCYFVKLTNFQLEHNSVDSEYIIIHVLSNSWLVLIHYSAISVLYLPKLVSHLSCTKRNEIGKWTLFTLIGYMNADTRMDRKVRDPL